MFLTQAFKKTLKIIKKNKGLFLLLFLAQLVFIIIFLYIQVKYQVAMVENFKEVIVSLEGIDPNTGVEMASLSFLQESARIINHWNQLKANFINLLIFSFIVFALGNGLNWSLTHFMVKKQNFLKLWGKFIAFSSIFFVPYLIIIYLIFQSSLFQNNPTASAQILIAVAAVFTYFALVSFAFIHLNFKKIFRKTFWEIGLKKFYWVLLVYAITLIILSVIIYLLYMSVNFWHISLVALFIILLVLAINILRIFLINSFLEIS